MNNPEDPSRELSDTEKYHVIDPESGLVMRPEEAEEKRENSDRNNP